jgi:hypothetical protein
MLTVTSKAMSHSDWSKEFLCTPDQVARWLAQMARPGTRATTLGTVMALPGGAAVVECQKKPLRMAGLEAVPVTQVNISFKGVAVGERDKFVQQFEDVARKALA